MVTRTLPLAEDGVTNGDKGSPVVSSLSSSPTESEGVWDDEEELVREVSILAWITYGRGSGHEANQKYEMPYRRCVCGPARLWRTNAL